MNISEEIVSKPGFLTITHKKNPSHIYFDWQNFQISWEDCKDAFAKAEKAMTRLGTYHIVSDILKVKEGLRPEVAQWWGEVCMPSLEKCGVKLIVNLVPAGPNTKTGETQVVNNIVMQTATTVSEAESLVRKFQSNKAV